MMSDFNVIETILSNWPKIHSDQELIDQACNRLYLVLKELILNPNNVGIGDIAGLIGHALRRKSLLQHKSLPEPIWKVPRGHEWPDKGIWDNFGFNIISSTPEAFLITANSWIPEWLEGNKNILPLRDSLCELQRRKNSAIPADPCVTVNTPFAKYTSRGQQAIIRNIFNSKPGATLLINLPTGAW